MQLIEATALHAAALRRRKRSPRTIEFYAFWLSALARFLACPRLDAVTLADLRAWIDSLIARNLAPASMRGAGITAKVLFTWCVREELINSSPASRLELPQRVHRQPDPLTTNDLLTVINSIQCGGRHPARDTALVCFLAETGCRRSEVVTLTASDVHMQEGYAVVVGKGNKQRWVFFGEATTVALADWLKVRPESATTLFGVAASGLREVLRRLSVRTGLHLTPHRFRRSAATLRAARRIDAPALQSMMGWTDLVTANAYVAATDVAAAAARTNPLTGIAVPRATT